MATKPNSIFWTAALFGSALCLGTPAAASIVEQGSSYGPNTITLDTATNEQWLNLSVTLGLSYDYVSSQLGAGGEFSGFRYATASDIISFFTDAGIPNLYIFDPDVWHPEDFAPVSALLGDLLPGQWQAEGVLGVDAGTILWTPPFTNVPGHFTASLTLCPSPDECDLHTAYVEIPPQSPSWADYTGTGLGTSVGQWILRDASQVPPPRVPEPATLALFGFGLAGVVGISRRRTMTRQRL